MKLLFWLLALLAAAVAVALSARFNQGYVLLVYAPYRIEIALSLLSLLLLTAFFAGYLLLRLFGQVLRLPSQVNAYRLRRARNKARSALQQAVVAYFEGNYVRAEKMASAALKLRELPALSAVIAARSAHEMRRYHASDNYLQVAQTEAPDTRVLYLVTRAELLLDERQVTDAIEVLKTARATAPKNVNVLKLELKARTFNKDWDEVLAIVDLLRKSDAIDASQAEQLRTGAHSGRLRDKAGDREALLEAWKSVPPAVRGETSVALIAARNFIDCDLHEQAREAIESSLEKRWNSDLAALYGECASADTVAQIERAERWLTENPNDASLLLSLGKLCTRQHLWGKARSYLDASLALEPSRAGHSSLAQLLEKMGLGDEALQYNRRRLEAPQTE
jgi:HemY protein